MKIILSCILILNSLHAAAQANFGQLFENCHVKGSTTIYDYNNRHWVITDSADANIATLPASTFKVINLLIALETRVIKDEHAVVKWTGKTDTTLYGYRPDIYRDMTVKEAFELSAGWVFIELAKRIGRQRYLHYLKACNYGNANLSEGGVDFWNFGAFAISPVNQVNFLVKVYKGVLPFSSRNLTILKKVMVTETKEAHTTRSKTGWTRWEGRDIGWWVGYTTTANNVYFFATRITKKRSDTTPDFSSCRKEITKKILAQLYGIYWLPAPVQVTSQ